MGSILPASLSLGWEKAKHAISAIPPDQLYERIFKVAAMFIVAVPLFVGIYESWRKKQVTNLQGYSNSLNPFTLYYLGVQELRSSHRSSKLETMPPSRAASITLEKLSTYQRRLLASRPDVLNEMHPKKLLYLYEFTTRKKEFLNSLTSGQLLAVFNHAAVATFLPDDEMKTFDLGKMDPAQARLLRFEKLSPDQLNCLASRADVVTGLTPDRLRDLYQSITVNKKELITNLSSPQLAAFLSNAPFISDKEFGTFELGLGTRLPSEVREIPLDKLSPYQLNILASRADVVNKLNPDKLLYLYQQTPSKKTEFVSRLNGRQLLALLNHRSFRSDAEFGTLELGLPTMPLSEASQIPLGKLSSYQLNLLASRADFVNGVNHDQLLCLYETTTSKKEFITNLSVPQLQALLNHQYFDPGVEFTATFESILDSRGGFRLSPSKLRKMPSSEACTIEMGRLTLYQLKIVVRSPELVNGLNPDQLLYLHDKFPFEEGKFIGFVARLSGRQLLGLVSHRLFKPVPHFYDLLVSRADFVNELNPDQLCYVYRQLADKTKEFVTHLSSSQLLALLRHDSLTLTDRSKVFELIQARQIDHVDIFEILCNTYSMEVCSLFLLMKKEFSRMGISLAWNDASLHPLMTNLISKIRNLLSSIPPSHNYFFFSQLSVNQFSLLFFSENQLHFINFKEVQFKHVECLDTGRSHQLTLNETSAENWLESVCNLFDETLMQDPFGRLYSDRSKTLCLLEAKTQLQKLSAKQAAFLHRRTDEMLFRDRVFRSVFSSQLMDSKFSDYKLEFDVETLSIANRPGLSTSEAYQILELDANASWDEIKAKYRKMARTHHPDKPSDKEKSSISFQTLSEAYQILQSIKAPNFIASQRASSTSSSGHR